MPGFDPSVKEFVPRFGASTFVPSAAASAPVAAVPVPAPVVPKQTAPVQAAPAASVAESWEDADEEKVISKDLEATTISVETPEVVADPVNDDAEEEEEEEPVTEFKFHDEREHVNVVFIGHVDAGKSTISGNLLCLTGHVDQRTIEKYEREAKEKNRESWFLAYVMDTNEEERSKGKTVETGRGQFSTAKKRYTILDTPGHKTFVPNMISGTSQADIGVLVISARKGEFETGFDRGGQTREHAMLAKTLGVERLIVVINKMDDPSVEWSQKRYDECVGKLTPYLKGCGFKAGSSVSFLPCSGMTGANLITPVSKAICPWYQGDSLINSIDALDPMPRNYDAPIRMPVVTRYKEMGCLFIMGKLEVGVMTLKSKLILVPGNQRVDLVGISTDDHDVECVRPGENILIKCRGIEEDDVRCGQVICSLKSPCPQSAQFVVKMQVSELLEHKSLITAGYEAVLHIHSIIVECQIVKLLHQFDKKGRRSKAPPVFVKSNSVVTCVLSVEFPIAIQTFEQCPQLGRLTLRDEGKTIAIGKVVALQYPPSRQPVAKA